MTATAKGKASYEVRAIEKSENHLRRRFRVVAMGRELRRAAANHKPADWEVADSAGKIEALIQVVSSKYSHGARMSASEVFRLLDTANQCHAQAFLTRYERGHLSTLQVHLINAQGLKKLVRLITLLDRSSISALKMDTSRSNPRNEGEGLLS